MPGSTDSRLLRPQIGPMVAIPSIWYSNMLCGTQMEKAPSIFSGLSPSRINPRTATSLVSYY